MSTRLHLLVDSLGLAANYWTIGRQRRVNERLHSGSQSKFSASVSEGRTDGRAGGDAAFFGGSDTGRAGTGSALASL